MDIAEIRNNASPADPQVLNEYVRQRGLCRILRRNGLMALSLIQIHIQPFTIHYKIAPAFGLVPSFPSFAAVSNFSFVFCAEVNSYQARPILFWLSQAIDNDSVIIKSKQDPLRLTILFRSCSTSTQASFSIQVITYSDPGLRPTRMSHPVYQNLGN